MMIEGQTYLQITSALIINNYKCPNQMKRPYELSHKCNCEYEWYEEKEAI